MKHEKRREKEKESGFTLLEYCAGAAIIAGVVWVAMDQLGGSLAGLLESLSSWASSRSGDIG